MARALRAWAINQRGKNSVRNLQYGPRTRLARGIYFNHTYSCFPCVPYFPWPNEPGDFKTVVETSVGLFERSRVTYHLVIVRGSKEMCNLDKCLWWASWKSIQLTKTCLVFFFFRFSITFLLPPRQSLLIRTVVFRVILKTIELEATILCTHALSKHDNLKLPDGKRQPIVIFQNYNVINLVNTEWLLVTHIYIGTSSSANKLIFTLVSVFPSHLD